MISHRLNTCLFDQVRVFFCLQENLYTITLLSHKLLDSAYHIKSKIKGNLRKMLKTIILKTIFSEFIF